MDHGAAKDWKRHRRRQRTLCFDHGSNQGISTTGEQIANNQKTYSVRGTVNEITTNTLSMWLFWLTALEFLLVYHCVVCKIRETLIVENEKKNLLSKVLVISWEKHLSTWCTDLVWLRRILLLEDTSIEEQNSSCRKCDRSSWDVKSISYGTYLILAKNKKYAAGEETRPLRGGAHLAKKNSYPARCEKQVTEWKKRHAFR